eukprot:INCI16199.4.p1 GENE.INCI16199.4~~INCI16199.4.p1  ORF type:complete len:841 (-),score=159.48 INCI16199.4:3548-6070(-)
MHVLGCCKDSSVFRNAADGTPLDTAEKWVIEDNSPDIAKQVTKWITPGVVRTAREQFGCSSMDGLPLEDVPLGSNAHWEARIMGSEVMSYGVGSGEPYISDITLMFFNDTNQYLVNLPNGTRRIYPATELDSADASGFNAFFASTSGLDGAANITNRTFSQGFQRWGRNGGCDFVNKPPSLDTWGAQYFCTDPDSRGCTGDRRMSGICYLVEYSSSGSSAGSVYYTRSLTSPSDTDSVNNPNTPRLPTQYQYLAPFGLTDYGGYNDAMDFAPIRYGTFSCLSERPEFADLAQLASESQYVEAEEVFVDFDDSGSTLLKQGGQVFSATSRCFESTLLLFSEAYYLDVQFQTQGLCYMSNCFRDNYLQIGVQGAFGGIKWFHCEEAGSLFVSGYIGSFKCPDPVEFCQNEDITGIKYAENNETLEWAFWAVLIGIVLILLIVFCCCKKARRDAVAKLKLLLNFDVDECKRQREAQNKEAKAAGGKRPCSPRAGCLTVLSWLWFLIGIAIVLLGVIALIDTTVLWDTAVRQVWHLLGFGICTILLAILGIMTARADRPTLRAMSLFYIILFLFVGVIFLVVIVFGVPTWLEAIVEAAWDTFRPQFPNSWQLYTATEAYDEMVALFMANAAYFYSAVVLILLSMTIGLLLSFLILRFRNVIGTMLFWVNLVVLACVIMYIVAVAALGIVLPTQTFAAVIVPAVWTAVSNVVGLFTCRHSKALVAYIVLTGLAFLAMLIAGIWLFVSVPALQEEMANLTSDDLSQVVQQLGFLGSVWSAKEVDAYFKATIQATGIAAFVISVLTLGNVGTGYLVMQKVKKDEILHGKGDSGSVNEEGLELGEIHD